MSKLISLVILSSFLMLGGCASLDQRSMRDVGVSGLAGTAAGALFGALACGRGNPDCVKQMAAGGMAVGAAAGYAEMQNRRAMEMAQQPIQSKYCERAYDARSGQWVLVNCREAVAQTTIGQPVPKWVPR